MKINLLAKLTHLEERARLRRSPIVVLVQGEDGTWHQPDGSDAPAAKRGDAVIHVEADDLRL